MSEYDAPLTKQNTKNQLQNMKSGAVSHEHLRQEWSYNRPFGTFNRPKYQNKTIEAHGSDKKNKNQKLYDMGTSQIQHYKELTLQRPNTSAGQTGRKLGLFSEFFHS